jgi:hypothetical protein
MIHTHCSTWRRAAMFLAALGSVMALGIATRADQLPDFTGYTRPGYPEGKAAPKENKVVFAAFDGKEQRAVLGGTVYFTVIDMRSGDPADPWSRVAAEMARDFVPGRGGDGMASPEFDGGARYLYLYQTVNDMPNAEDAVRSSSVYLIDAELLTSWGYFASHGFAAEVEDKTGKSVIRPLSSDFVLDTSNRVYRRWDSEHITDTGYAIGKYPSRGKGDIRPVAKGEDPVRSPDNVVLVMGSDLYYRSSLWLGYDLRPPRFLRGEDADTSDRLRNRPIDIDHLQRSYIRANWIGKNLLKPGERGALFGFTSNYPPTYDDVRLRGVGTGNAAPRVSDIKPAATDGGGVVVPASGTGPIGTVPVPVPAAAAPAVTGGAATGFLGGSVPFGGAPAAAGGLPLGGGLAVPASAAAPGATGIPTTGGNSGTQTQSPSQSQQQPQTQNQSQNLSQSQSQSQSFSPTINVPVSQSQSQSQSLGNITPAPSSLLLAALGTPALLYLWRRNSVLGRAAA